MKKLLVTAFLIVMYFTVENAENQVWTIIEKEPDIKELILARIIDIESNGNELAYNHKEDAVGILQIRKIMVDEINRLTGQQIYDYNDRWCPDKSIQMFITYQDIVNPEWDEETAARKWNGGINGDKYQSTLAYWDLYKSKNYED